MTKINASGLHFKPLNEALRASERKDITIDNCVGQRYIGCGLSQKQITINGTPGNALGAYLDGAELEVFGNAQEATGDTMNDGKIIIHGSAGDATGYAMRGGRIYVEGNSGYRTGIHMKAYQEKLPVLVVGGTCGSFLGEYQAGGLIIVLRQNKGDEPFHSNFCATGMHGGKIIIRCDSEPIGLISQVSAKKISAEELQEIRPYLAEFCEAFQTDLDALLQASYYVITPDSKNPFKQLYVHN